MSTKVNAFILAAYAAIGVTAPVIAATPVLESLLNDYKVSEVRIVQVDDMGRCVAFAAVQIANETPVLRPVAAVSGDIKLYSDLSATIPMVQRAKLQSAADVQFYRKAKMSQLGDPLATLKTSYKAFKSEKLAVDKMKIVIDAKIIAAQALGWDTSVGTPERHEFDDYIARRASTNEAIAYCAGRITALAASLTAAGIDPATLV